MVRRQKLIIKDERGVPNYMAAFSWTGSKDPAQAPPMFVVCGEVVDAILISQFHNTNIEGIPHSLPYREPWTKIDLDSAARACRAKGEGWHLLTNTEYAYLLAESRDLGTEPHGNTEGGRDYDFPEECGVTYDGRRTLTGLDPVTWSHDHTENGVYGLKGNVWEMVTGLRLQKGRVDYIPNNDAAVVSMASDSAAWQQAKTEDGKTIYLSGGNGVTITTDQAKEDWDGAHMRDIRLDGLESIPQIIFDLAILPPDYKERKDGIYVDSELAEAVPCWGSGFDSTSHAGASAVDLGHPRSHVYVHVGFRSALYVKDWKQITGKLIGA